MTDHCAKYNGMFNLKDADDLRYFMRIPHCDPAPLLQYLRKWVNLLQLHRFTVKQFAQFKQDIISYDLPGFVNLTCAARRADFPHVMFDLQWEQLNTGIAIFVANMMIENTSVVDIPRLPDNNSMWPVIDALIIQ